MATSYKIRKKSKSACIKVANVFEYLKNFTRLVKLLPQEWHRVLRNR